MQDIELRRHVSIIINKCIENMSQAGIAQLPNRQAIHKIIRRKRDEVNQVPENPSSIQELELPHEYKIYKPAPGIEENLCLMDRGTGNDRFIIFGRELVGTSSNFKHLVCRWNICDCTTFISSSVYNSGQETWGRAPCTICTLIE